LAILPLPRSCCWYSFGRRIRSDARRHSSLVYAIFSLLVCIYQFRTFLVKKRRATAYGIVATGSSIGGALFPIIVDRLIPRVGYAVCFLLPHSRHMLAGTLGL
jgi:hypothetical protein